jgi:hypothetical protein
MLKEEETPGLGNFKRVEATSFGSEVGGDIPRWWIFAREKRVQELSRDTRRILPAAQVLVRSAEKLGFEVATTYANIIDQLGRFLRRYSNEIEILEEYVDSLAAKDELAPAILFSYAVWGSTTRGDRSLRSCTREEFEMLRLAGELALGIRVGILPPLLAQYIELLEEVLGSNDAMDNKDFISIPTDRLLYLTQMRIRENLVVYFTKLRDSLRHIDTLSQEFFSVNTSMQMIALREGC